jgi:cytoskeletal protein CcmA (bactofilin family)
MIKTTNMFNKERPNQNDRSAQNSATLISAGTTLNGDLSSENDLRIDGTIIGNVHSSAKIILGATGMVEGNIEGQQADITGKVIGNIIIKDLLQLRGPCHVQGNISADKLQIEPTATFNGQCSMGTVASIVQMTTNELSAAEAH